MLCCARCMLHWDIVLMLCDWARLLSEGHLWVWAGLIENIRLTLDYIPSDAIVQQ